MNRINLTDLRTTKGRRMSDITIDLNGCARCWEDGHAGLLFRELTHPLECDNQESFTHWAPCPTNGEPILMRHLKKEES